MIVAKMSATPDNRFNFHNLGRDDLLQEAQGMRSGGDESVTAGIPEFHSNNFLAPRGLSYKDEVEIAATLLPERSTLRGLGGQVNIAGNLPIWEK